MITSTRNRLSGYLLLSPNLGKGGRGDRGYFTKYKIPMVSGPQWLAMTLPAVVI
jgi:hypothetical protein